MFPLLPQHHKEIIPFCSGLLYLFYWEDWSFLLLSLCPLFLAYFKFFSLSLVSISLTMMCYGFLCIYASSLLGIRSDSWICIFMHFITFIKLWLVFPNIFSHFCLLYFWDSKCTLCYYPTGYWGPVQFFFFLFYCSVR